MLDTRFRGEGMPASSLVRTEGFEPSQPSGHMVLSHARIPFRHERRREDDPVNEPSSPDYIKLQK